jgi:sirohydrochlorin cobaltochelatase
MQKKIVSLLAIVLLLLPALALAHGHDRPEKKGILLVAFGSSVPQARVSFENIDKTVKATFKGMPVRWAYTSAIIRNKLAKQGEVLDSVAMALAKMTDDGFTQVAVQSLHTIRGEEYDDLAMTAKAFEGMPNGIRHIVLGAPMISSQKDIEAVAQAVVSNIPKQRKPGEAVVLMGHGTPHPSNAFYAAMMFNLQKIDPNIYVGTVEGSPEIGDIQAMLTKNKVKSAYLIPFMSVAGDHARNDMAGDEDDSWKSLLTKAGIDCKTVLKGTAEYDNMVAIWVKHLTQAVAHFKG